MRRVKVRYAGSTWDGVSMVRLLETLAPQCAYDSRALAGTLGISSRHLRRIFALTFVLAPREWLHEQRLLTARARLPGALSVKEVAYSLGFQSVSQFSRDFRARFDMAPSALLGGATPIRDAS